MQHELKTIQPYFDDVVSGMKTFELRDATDRNFNPGDIIVLLEYVVGKTTGKKHVCLCTYVIHGPLYGLKEGFCIIGIQNFDVDIQRTIQNVYCKTT